MRHHKGVRKLGKTPSHRRAMLRNMVTSLFRHERITTTAPKAKEAKRWADRMITLGKRGLEDPTTALHVRRQAATFVNDETVLKKLFDEIAPSFKERQGGYTRIMRTGVRKGDVAEMAILELVTKSPARQKPVNRKSRARLAKFEPTGEREPKAGRKAGKKKSAAPKAKAAAEATAEA
jgi:large subunit ribosomal protein L17